MHACMMHLHLTAQKRRRRGEKREKKEKKKSEKKERKEKRRKRKTDRNKGGRERAPCEILRPSSTIRSE